MQDVGYDQALINDPSAVAAAQGAIFSVLRSPVEEKTAATQREQGAFEQYEHFSGVPNLNWTYGWLSADLTIQGLEGGWSEPNTDLLPQRFAQPQGLDRRGPSCPLPPDFSLADFGKLPSQTTCSYYVKLVGKEFVPMNTGKPICGQFVKS